ncbi:hypothetical protein KY348_00260 [Candidatus Woesearchaeota archaeon]|nr:hypothetical protein [Candidatus Woesearchaeota archaeon]
MGVVDNIMGAVLVVLILLIAGIIYLSLFAREASQDISVTSTAFFNGINTNNFNTVLKITEENSQKSLGVLISEITYYRSLPAQSDDGPNVTGTLKDLLDTAFSTNDYYFKAEPELTQISLNFVFDGTPSSMLKRNVLANNLVNIIDFTQEKMDNKSRSEGRIPKNSVTADVYIMGPRGDKCNIFDDLNRVDINCHGIRSNEIYLSEDMMQGLFVPGFLLDYEMYPPFGFEWIEEDANREDSYVANEEDYYQADWGFGTAYVSHKLSSAAYRNRLNLIFPVSDELSTSSIPDDCFYKTFIPDWVVCALCEDECPVERANISISKAIEVATDYNHVLIPVYGYGGDYEITHPQIYDWNGLAGTSRYVDGFGSPGNTWCDASGCGGCSEQQGGICFHPDCASILQEHMNRMADETNGIFIDLTASQQEFADTIFSTISNIMDQFTIEIGVKNESRERDVVEVKQPLPDGNSLPLKLWVYKNQNI